MKAMTSQSSPLRIAEVRFGDGEGRLGLTICPGKQDRHRGWARDLDEDLRLIRHWGATTIVSLIEPHEFDVLQVSALGHRTVEMGMHWVPLPIRDVDVPDARFEVSWQTQGPPLHHRLEAGERVLIHCRGGLGRTGLVAARILVERGCPARDAIHRVRAVRPRAIETRDQETYVLSLPTSIIGKKGAP